MLISSDESYNGVAYTPRQAYEWGTYFKGLIETKDLKRLLKNSSVLKIMGVERDKAETMKFDKLFPKKWQQEILNEPVECKPVGYRGFILGNGLMWYEAAQSDEWWVVHFNGLDKPVKSINNLKNDKHAYDTIPDGVNIYSQSLGKWINKNGYCNICTVQNGYTASGYYNDDINTIFWREVHLELKGDDGTTPKENDVNESFDYGYVNKYSKYKTYSKLINGVHHIFVPMEKGAEHIDFFWKKGYVNAAWEYKIIWKK